MLSALMLSALILSALILSALTLRQRLSSHASPASERSNMHAAAIRCLSSKPARERGEGGGREQRE
eukprot:3551576-Rhodomonas_salina.1